MTVALRLRRHWALSLVLGAYLVLGTLYSVTTPAFEAYDEAWHYPYIKYLADGHGLPVQPGTGDYPWHQEGSQPPLYYALGAALTFWIDTGPPQRIYQRNPHATAGDPAAMDNKNMIIHGPEEGFPYRGVYLAVHLIRLLTVLMGAAMVVFVYLTAWELRPDQALAAAAAALVAFNPTFLFVSASVNNDNLINVLAAIILWMSLRLLKGARPRPVIFGLLLGGAALAKLSGLWLLPLVAIAGVYRGWKDQAWLRWGEKLVMTLVVAALIAGWWYLRNWWLYGDPTGLNLMLSIAGGRSDPPNLAEGEGVFISYWGLFGGSNVAFSEPVYRTFEAAAVIALVGLAAWLVLKKEGTERPAWPLMGFLVLWGLVFLAALYRWSLLTYGSAGRLLFPASGAFSSLLALGLLGLFPHRVHPWVATGIGLSLLGLAATVPFTTILPAYPGPPLVAEEALDQATAIYVNYGDKIELVGYELSTRELRPDDGLEVVLYFRALDTMERDYTLYVHLFSPPYTGFSQRDSYPGGGSYPTSRWQPGELIRDRYRLPVPTEAVAEAPTALWLQVGFYNRATEERLAPRDAQGREVTPWIARLKLAPAQAPAYQPSHIQRVSFGDSLELLGYDLEGSPWPGGTVSITLYWQALKPLDADYTVFVQLLEPNHPTPWAQEDVQPRRGNYPTSLWEPGEVVADTHQLRIPQDLPPGNYYLAAGLYRLPGMEHLRVAESGEMRAVLAKLAVGAARS